MSPVITALEVGAHAGQEHLHLFDGGCFCASSMMMNASFERAPRAKGQGRNLDDVSSPASCQPFRVRAGRRERRRAAQVGDQPSLASCPAKKPSRSPASTAGRTAQCGSPFGVDGGHGHGNS